MNRSGMVTIIRFTWAHLVGQEQLHEIQSLPAEHTIKIVMFEWNFQIISKKTDRWPHVDERVAIVQPSVDHQDLNILFRTHHSSIISIKYQSMQWINFVTLRVLLLLPHSRPRTLPHGNVQQHLQEFTMITHY